jgi:hypothetical protein
MSAADQPFQFLGRIDHCPSFPSFLSVRLLVVQSLIQARLYCYASWPFNGLLFGNGRRASKTAKEDFLVQRPQPAGDLHRPSKRGGGSRQLLAFFSVASDGLVLPLSFGGLAGQAGLRTQKDFGSLGLLAVQGTGGLLAPIYLPPLPTPLRCSSSRFSSTLFLISLSLLLVPAIWPSICEPIACSLPRCPQHCCWSLPIYR